MRRPLLLTGAALLLLGAVMTSCAHAPRTADSDTILRLRHDYLSSNPAGEFNAYIQRGEVVRGMNFVEVIASWGFPDSRLAVPERNLEYWRYASPDDQSRDWIQYTFVFERKALIEWEMSRHVSKSRAMAQIDLADPLGEPVRVPPPRASNTGTGAPRK